MRLAHLATHVRALLASASVAMICQAGPARAADFPLGPITVPTAFAIRQRRPAGAFFGCLHVLDRNCGFVRICFDRQHRLQQANGDPDLNAGLYLDGALLFAGEAETIFSPEGFPSRDVAFSALTLGPGNYELIFTGTATSFDPSLPITSSYAGLASFVPATASDPRTRDRRADVVRRGVVPAADGVAPRHTCDRPQMHKAPPDHRCRVFGSPWPGVYGTHIESVRHYGRHWHATYGLGLLEHGAQARPADAARSMRMPRPDHDQPRRGARRPTAGRPLAPLADRVPGSGGDRFDERRLRILRNRCRADAPVIKDTGLSRALQRLFDRLDEWSAARNPNGADVLACDEALVQACALAAGSPCHDRFAQRVTRR